MKKKVLVVEDSPTEAAIIQAILEEIGIEVIMAEDGSSGLKKARAEKPDLILLDIFMPNIDGLQVCMWLRSDEQIKDIPIVLLSAAEIEDREKICLNYGAKNLIRKPFEPRELIAKVRALLK